MRGYLFVALLVASVIAAGCASREVRQVENRVGKSLALPREAKDATARANLLTGAADELAELGSADAEKYYKKAVNAAPTNPYTRFSYGEYFRQYRGPGRPLVPEAFPQYSEALKLIGEQRARAGQAGEGTEKGLANLRTRIEWSLTDLYQRDGLPLLYWPPSLMVPAHSYDRPSVFLSTQYEFGQREVPIRDLTSSALFTSDSLGRELTKQELRSLVHSKDESDLTTRIRVRPGDWPWVDVWWSQVRADDANINRWAPGDFFDFHEHTVGFAAERTVDLYPVCDALVRGGYRNSRRTVNMDEEGNLREEYDTPFAQLALSRTFPTVWGASKLTLDLERERSHIWSNEGVPREASASAVVLRYSLYPASEFGRFVLRSHDIEAGVLRNTQKYGAVDVHQRDRFIGVTARRVFVEGLDLSLRYTAYEEDKEHSLPERSHEQGRVSFTPLWRFIDNEAALPDANRYSPVRVLSASLPFDYTFRREGPPDFESYAYGFRMDAKVAHPDFLRTTFLLFAEYTHRDYFRLDKSLNQVVVGAKMGF